MLETVVSETVPGVLMFTITVRQTSNLRAGILLLAAVAAVQVGFSQPVLEADADRQREIIERIEQEQARNGPYSEGLIIPLSELALLHQHRGDHVPAVAVIHRVLHVIRVNKGLYALEQASLIQQLIANEEAIGRVDTAWQLEQDLLTLVGRHPSDLRTVPTLREIAAKRMAVLRQYLAGEFPPQIVLGCYYSEPKSIQPQSIQGTMINLIADCTSGTRDAVVRGIVSDAQRYYSDAIAVMLRNQLYSSDELRELELELLRSIKMIPRGGVRTSPFEPWRSRQLAVLRLAQWEFPQLAAESGFEQDVPRDGEPESVNVPRNLITAYGIGRRSLERLLAYEIATSAPLQTQMEALLRIADWDLLYRPNNRLALEEYELVHEMLNTAGNADSLIAEFFAPPVPIVLPTLSSNPLATDHTPATTGYIDVAFEITRHGKSRRVRILDTTTNATDAAKRRLIRLILDSRFRPRVTDGQFPRASPIVLRYYLTE
jgi:hypothetical protein